MATIFNRGAVLTSNFLKNNGQKVFIYIYLKILQTFYLLPITPYVCQYSCADTHQDLNAVTNPFCAVKSRTSEPLNVASPRSFDHGTLFI